MLIRLLSLNIWDLPVPLPFERRSRRRLLLERLAATDADLVLFQEAFQPSFRPQLAAALSGHQPDHCFGGSRRHLMLSMDTSGGLATFSRTQPRETRYHSFPLWSGMKADERIGRKGCLWTEHEFGGIRVRVGNAHLYAGLTARDGRARSVQTRHLLHQLDRLPPLPTIVAGDFNMTIEYERTTTGPTGFDLMHAAGFTEIAAGVTGAIATMSPSRNRFARFMPWPKPERRLTQVFYRGEGIQLAEPPTLCFCDPPVSDHFGLLTTFHVE